MEDLPAYEKIALEDVMGLLGKRRLALTDTIG